MARKKDWKKCAVRGCRKGAVDGNLCPLHQKKSGAGKAMDASSLPDEEKDLYHMEPLELAQLSVLESELRRIRAEFKEVELVTYKLEREYQDQKASLTVKRKNLTVEMGTLKPKYDEKIQYLSEESGVPVESMLINYESGIVRDQKQV